MLSAVVFLLFLSTPIIFAEEYDDKLPGATSFQSYTRRFKQHHNVQDPTNAPVSYPFQYEKRIPFPVPVAVPIDRPVPVHVPKPYPVPVVTGIPYPVEKPIPYPVKVFQPISGYGQEPFSLLARVPYQYQSSNYIPFQQHYPDTHNYNQHG